MSIVNIALGKERALVGCDTACLYEVGKAHQHGQMSKLLVLHGMGVVMAYRGQRHMFHQVINRCLFTQEPDSFDELIQRMPSFIEMPAESQPVESSLDLTLELYVVGWSSQRGRMTGAVYVVDASGRLADSHIDTWRHACSPELPEDPSPLLDTHEAMLAHARRQTHFGRTVFSQYPIGGRYFIADVTRDQILVSYAGMLSEVP